MQTIARRAPGKDPRRTLEPFLAVDKQDSEKDNNLRANEEYDYAVDPKNSLEVPQMVAGTAADNFVRVVGQPADSFVIVVKVGPNPLKDEQLEFSAFFKP